MMEVYLKNSTVIEDYAFMQMEKPVDGYEDHHKIISKIVIVLKQITIYRRWKGERVSLTSKPPS